MDAWLELRIPISPREYFFNRVQFIALSVRSLGGRYANTITRVAVGSDEEPYDLHERLPWSRELGIEWFWVDRAEFASWRDTKNSYAATIVHRFKPPFTARNVLVLDPDVIALQPFDDIIGLVETHPGVAGVMAHVSPFTTLNPLDHIDWWTKLYQLMGMGQPEFAYPHSGFGLRDTAPERRMSPPYLNSGVVLAPAALLEKLWDSYLEATALLKRVAHTYYYDQIAFTLALAKQRLPVHSLPLRFNFPNDPAFDNAFPDELEDARFIHFLLTSVVDRDAAFQNFSTIAALTERRDLSGSNELLRWRVQDLMPLATQVRAAEVASG